MIDKIKSELVNYIGNNVILKEDIGRNKYEIYEGVLDTLYDNVFIIIVNGVKKSYSYSDLLTRLIILKFV